LLFVCAEENNDAQTKYHRMRNMTFNDSVADLTKIASEIDEYLPEEIKSTSSAAEIGRRLQNEPFRVLVLGEFSRGKSTFVNAILGDKVLPVSVRPTTSVISIIRNSTKRTATVSWNDPSRSPETIAIPFERPSKALEVLTTKNDEANQIKSVAIEISIPDFNLPVELVDTPGVNDIDTQREEITYGYLSKADAAIMMLDLHQPLSASESKFLTEKVLGSDISKLLFVINKIDQEQPESLNKALQYVDSRLRKLYANGKQLISEPIILPVASKLALKARQTDDLDMLANSKFHKFIVGLTNFLERESGFGRIETAKNRIKRLANEGIEEFQNASDQLDQDRSGIASRLEAIGNEAKKVLAEQTHIEARIKIDVAQFRSDATSQMRAKISALRKELECAVSNVDAPDKEWLNKLQSKVNLGLRDTVEIPPSLAASVARDLIKRFGLTVTSTTAIQRSDGLSKPENAQSNTTDEEAVETGIGLFIGGFVGGMFFGPIGGIPLAVFGGWLGNQFSKIFGNQQARAQNLVKPLLTNLENLDDRCAAVVNEASKCLGKELEKAIVQPRQLALAQKQRESQLLRNALQEEGHVIKQKIERLNHKVSELRQLVDRINSMEEK
jgi:small GTP-binding protein